MGGLKQKGAGGNGTKRPKQAKSKKELKRTTTKKERQAAKAAKKAEQTKTRTERQAEVQDIKDRLVEWGVTTQFPSVAKLFVAMDEFVETGEPSFGTLHFPEAPPQPQGRNIVYKLPTRRGNRCTCDLIVREGGEFLDEESSQQKQQQHQLQKQQALPQYPDYAAALQKEMDRIQAELGPAKSVEEARQMAEKVVPSVESIQAELDRLYLSSTSASQNHASGDGTIPVDTVNVTEKVVVEILEDGEEK